MKYITFAVVGFVALGCARVQSGDRGLELRVLVYNIHAGADASGVNNIERVAGIIRDTKADIVLLQEVDKGVARSKQQDQPADLARLTGLNVAFGKSLDYQGGLYGIAILARFPILADTAQHLPVNPPQLRSGASYEPRVALWTLIGTQPVNIAVVNTHLDPSREDTYRLQEISQIKRIFQVSGGLNTVVLMGGDFNSEPESAVQQTMRASGARDAWSECGKGQALTYPANVPVKRIDYLFLSPRTSCRDAHVLDTQASDHRPVLFTVNVRTSP